MNAPRCRKIGKLGRRMRLVSPEGGKIAQVGSLARWKRLFPAILWMRGLSDYLSRLPDRLPVSLVARSKCTRCTRCTDLSGFFASRGVQGQAGLLQERPRGSRSSQGSPGEAQE